MHALDSAPKQPKFPPPPPRSLTVSVADQTVVSCACAGIVAPSPSAPSRARVRRRGGRECPSDLCGSVEEVRRWACGWLLAAGCWLLSTTWDHNLNVLSRAPCEGMVSQALARLVPPKVGGNCTPPPLSLSTGGVTKRLLSATLCQRGWGRPWLRPLLYLSMSLCTIPLVRDQAAGISEGSKEAFM